MMASLVVSQGFVPSGYRGRKKVFFLIGQILPEGLGIHVEFVPPARVFPCFYRAYGLCNILELADIAGPSVFAQHYGCFFREYGLGHTIAVCEV